MTLQLSRDLVRIIEDDMVVADRGRGGVGTRNEVYFARAGGRDDGEDASDLR